MNELNRKIINDLQNNGRQSFAEIGRNVGLSAPAVAERVQKMEEAGIIKGYSVLLDLEKLGCPVQAQITLKTAMTDFRTLVSKLDQFPEILECTKLTGENCVSLRVAVKNNSELEGLIDRLTRYGHPNTSIVLSSYQSSVRL
ncbi:MAG: Lrp/AsnC family transcriptional regulator [Bacteroidota bacterium]